MEDAVIKKSDDADEMVFQIGNMSAQVEFLADRIYNLQDKEDLHPIAYSLEDLAKKEGSSEETLQEKYIVVKKEG